MKIGIKKWVSECVSVREREIERVLVKKMTRKLANEWRNTQWVASYILATNSNKESTQTQQNICILLSSSISSKRLQHFLKNCPLSRNCLCAVLKLLNQKTILWPYWFWPPLGEQTSRPTWRKHLQPAVETLPWSEKVCEAWRCLWNVSVLWERHRPPSSHRQRRSDRFLPVGKDPGFGNESVILNKCLCYQ